MDQKEIERLQDYLRFKFSNKSIVVLARKETKDSVEVYLGSEFIGLIYKDIDEGEISYDFNMAILESDLAPPA